MIDRQSQNPGRVKITLDDGTVMYGTIERADNPSAVGTPLNKNTLFNSVNSERYACDVPSEAFGLLTRELIVAVLKTGWSSEMNADGYYTQTVEVAGINSQHAPIFVPDFNAATNVDDINDAFSFIVRMTTSNGSVTFFATDVPSADITIRLRGV